MAEKKALLVLADALDLNGSGEALDKLKKKAAVLPHADAAGLKELAVAVNAKAGTVGRAVNAQDIAVTIATIADLPVDESCTGAIIYQVMKNPNLKLEEIKKLKEALVRMESVIQRDNREPWDKHDCA